MQSAWPKVMRLFCTPLCRQTVGLGALPSAPWIQSSQCFPVPWRAAPSPLSVCVSSAMHFPVGITPLGTKRSNSGHSVPGPELGLQSPAGSGLEGSWLRVATPLLITERCYILKPFKRLFVPILWMSVCPTAGEYRPSVLWRAQ